MALKSKYVNATYYIEFLCIEVSYQLLRYYEDQCIYSRT